MLKKNYDVAGSPSTVSLTEEEAGAVLIVWGLRGFLRSPASQWGAAYIASEPELTVGLGLKLDEFPKSTQAHRSAQEQDSTCLSSPLSQFLLPDRDHQTSTQ